MLLEYGWVITRFPYHDAWVVKHLLHVFGVSQEVKNQGSAVLIQAAVDQIRYMPIWSASSA